jgi:intracellular sulfur oxidation DsrE/DsrF family protein
MASNPIHVGVECITLPADTDLSTKQYYFVDCNSDGEVVVAGAGATFVGVLGNTPAAAGQAAEVMISGVVPVVCGGTVATGAAVKIDAAGKAVAASSGDKAVGRALSAGAAGVQANILLQPHVMA